MMQRCVLLLLACVCAHAAPVDPADPAVKPGSCKDAQVLGAATQAMTKINQDRSEGYVLSLHRLSNVNQMTHGETGVVFYLTMDVVETYCHVTSKKDWKSCPIRLSHDTPVYGQCKAAIYINKVQRVVRLYNYNCMVRPAPAEKVAKECPDCSSMIAMDNAEILKTATLSMEKFNKENGLANHFALLNITRASAQLSEAQFYFVEYTIQETTCANLTDPAQATKCPLMECEFAHKGHCKGSHSHTNGKDYITVDCDVHEPEAADKEKKLHLLGGETDHSHTDKHADGEEPAHDHSHDVKDGHAHDHTKEHGHDHTKEHSHEHTHTHADGTTHHHPHVHAASSDHNAHDHAHDHAHAHAHAHDHSHDQNHDHHHEHHSKAHNHTSDSGPHQHHKYVHAEGGHTHEHDHEISLDHDHKHAHLHEHEHHHHHHEHSVVPHHHPEGRVTVLPALGLPVTMPSFPDTPVAGAEQGVTLPLVPDPQVPGEREPTIVPFPTAVSAECPAEVKDENSFLKQLFAEDPLFKTGA